MDLHFLCPYHEHLVLRDKARAEELWQGLVAQGKLELGQKQWARAASFFGSASEIALLRASVEQNHQQVASLDKLLYASEFLIDSFCHIGDLESASAYIAQLNTNGQKLFLRKPWSRNSSLQETQVKQSFTEVIEKCYRTIELAENDRALQGLAESKSVAMPSKSPEMSKTSVSKITGPNKRFKQKQETTSDTFKDTREWGLAMSNQVH